MKKGTKHEKLEKQRKSFFLIGVIIALGLALVAFEWRTYDYSLSGLVKIENTWIDRDYVLPTKHKKPKPPPPAVKPVAAIKEVTNDSKVADHEIFDAESTEDMEVPEFIYTPPEEPEEGQSLDFVLIAEESPEFPGGEVALMQYLVSKTHFTNIALESGISGKVFIEFIIEKDGSVSNAAVKRGLGFGLDAIALEAVKGMPRWKPGKQRGMPVRVLMVVPFNFKLK